MDTKQKQCTKCGETKEHSLFGVARREKDGLQDWCKDCRAASSKAAKERRRLMDGAESLRPMLTSECQRDTARCHECKTDLPLSAFGKRIGRCKACACATAKRARERMILTESELPPTSPKRCGRCKDTKTLADFQRGTRCCRVCQNEKTAEYEAKFPERKKAKSRRYSRKNRDILAQKRKFDRLVNREWWRNWDRAYGKTEKGMVARRNTMHKRRVAIGSSTVTADQMVELKAKAKGRCYYCGKKSKSLSFDHITPIALGGQHAMDNMVMACMPCNQSKSARDPMEYAKTKGMLLI